MSDNGGRVNDDAKKARVNVTLNVEVLERIDEYARLNGISRSGTISVLVMQSLLTNDSMSAFKEFMTKIETSIEK